MATDTKTRLLDSSEKLFSEFGIGATSLRTITAAAGANLAAVNYHFGSKEALVRAVLDRRLVPLMKERLRMLEECGEPRAGDAESLENIVRALAQPFFDLLHRSDERGDDFPRLLGRAHFEADPVLREIFLDNFRPTMERFLARLRLCLPALSNEELFSRLLFSAGTLATGINVRLFLIDSAAGVEMVGPQTLEQQLVAFLCAGFLAPPAAAVQGS